MTTTLSAVRAEFLDRVASGLRDLPSDDHEEVLQDLRAHLAELDEDEIVTVLGSPEDFVDEFRASAGLGKRAGAAPKRSLAQTRARLEASGHRLAEVVSWHTWRLAWIWARGWLLISTFAVLASGTAFRRYPIPAIGESTPMGLSLVVAATWASVWLDRRRTRPRELGSFLFSVAAIMLLVASLISGASVSPLFMEEAQLWYPDRMVGPEGQIINNVYAYDLDGNPVEVLLFDQDGRPLRNFPTWVYEEAELSAQHGPVSIEDGLVEFPRDEFGRIIPNLYPLVLYRYGEFGSRLELVPPPPLGFPGSSERQESDDNSITTTTVSPTD